jgi:hypothetical protein
VFYFENSGTYAIRNTLAKSATGTHLFFFYSDDIMKSCMIERLTREQHRCIRFKFETFTHRISTAKNIDDYLAPGVFLIEKKEFLKQNGFQNWQCGADSEFHTRTGKQLQTHGMYERLFYRREHQCSLSNSPELGLNTEKRNEYAKMIGKTKRPKQLHTANYIEMSAKKRSFNLATYPKRAETLPIVIDSIYDQADIIRVYLNQYEFIPECLKRDKIEIAFGLKDIQDTGKFYFAETVKNEYYFTIDDDIQYAPDYAERMINAMIETGSRVVTMHGTIYKTPQKITDRVAQYAYFDNLNEHKKVNYAGTGCTMFDNSRLTVLRSSFKNNGMTDQYFALEMQKLEIPILCVKHNAMKALPTVEALWSRHGEFHEKNMRVFNQFKDWKIY